MASPTLPASLQGRPLCRPQPFPGSCLPACWTGGKAGPRGLQSPCPQVTVGLPGRLHSAVRKSGSHQIKLWALPTPPPPQEALPPPSPSQPCTEAGVPLGTNFTTISLWFHYECPDPGQPPRLLGPPLHPWGQEASLPLRQQPEDAWAALKKDFPTDSVVPEQAESWSQEACATLPGPLEQGPAAAWIPWRLRGRSGGCPLVVPYGMAGVLMWVQKAAWQNLGLRKPGRRKEPSLRVKAQTPVSHVP